MLIAFDFDGVLSEDLPMWRQVWALMVEAGHSAICVTARPELRGEPVRAAVADIMPIVFAGGTAKLRAARAAGFEVDVWIDDNPASIGQSMVSGARFRRRRRR